MRVMVWGLPAALSVKVRDLEYLVKPVGLNFAVTVQAASGASETPQLLVVTLKGELVVTDWMLTAV